jgi:ABC-type uncharacterized transport system substrate-binding protein
MIQAHTEASHKTQILIAAGPYYKKIVDSLLDYLPSSDYDITLIYIQKNQLHRQFKKNTHFIVSIGREATLKTQEWMQREELHIPTVALLIPHRMYHQIVKIRSPIYNTKRIFTAIYREQPVERQLQILNKLLPNIRSVGVLTTADDPEQLEALKKETLKRHLNLVISENKNHKDLIESLKYVLDHAEVLLALPDPNIYNPFTAKGILVTTFRRGIPIIGYSKASVDAGAVAAVYVQPAQIAQQAAGMVHAYFINDNQNLPDPGYSNQYSVATNLEVLHALRKNKK